MSKSKYSTKNKLTATKLRALLIAGLALITVGGVALFYYASDSLKESADETSRAVADAEASNNSLQALQTIKSELDQQRTAVERTSKIIASDRDFEYQNQIINDLSKYASQAGISLTNINFDTASAAGGGAAATPAPAEGGAAPGGSAAIGGGVKPVTVTITVDNPVNYNNLLSFIRLTEQNLTKMQISKLSLSTDGTSSNVSSETLTIEVYVR